MEAEKVMYQEFGFWWLDDDDEDDLLPWPWPAGTTGT
jgi:hypothetical protein